MKYGKNFVINECASSDSSTASYRGEGAPNIHFLCGPTDIPGDRRSHTKTPALLPLRAVFMFAVLIYKEVKHEHTHARAGNVQVIIMRW